MTYMHQKIIDSAIRKYSQVYIFIMEGEKTKDLPKNFLSFDDRVDIIKITNPSAKPILARMGYLPDIISAHKIPTAAGVGIIAGSDRIQGYIQQFKKVKYEVFADEIPRTAEDVSASKVRKALEEDDYYNYSRMIAKGLDNRKYFELFKRAFNVKKIQAMENFNPADLLDILIEDVNVHMTHYEDNILSGEEGIKQNIKIAEDLRDSMSGDSISKSKVTVKWDGAPAIIFGNNPENGNFFVSTKSLFNKTPKIAYTSRDVDNLFGHAPGLAEKLKIGLKYLPQLKPNGIYQGDFLFSEGDLKADTIDGEKCITFNPNTIVYTVPADSPLAKEIKKAKMGLVVHTQYKGKSVTKLSADFNINISHFAKTANVWVQDAFIKDYSGIVNFTDKELSQVNGILQAMVKTNVNFGALKGRDVASLIMSFRNDRIKLGWGVISSNVMLDEFIKYLGEMGAKNKSSDRYEDLIGFLRSKTEVMRNLFNIYNWCIKLKMIFVRKFEQIRTIGTFLQSGDGYKITTPEGFVAIANDGQVLKLVDRLEFSRANFANPKFQR